MGIVHIFPSGPRSNSGNGSELCPAGPGSSSKGGPDAMAGMCLRGRYGVGVVIRVGDWKYTRREGPCPNVRAEGP